MSLAVVATVFGLIFVAELPDKSALASLVLGTTFRTRHVFAGVAAAFAVHVLLAIVAGSLLALLPHTALQIVVAVLFAAGAIVLLLRRPEAATPTPGDRGGDHGETRHQPPQGRPARSGGVATVTTMTGTSARRDGLLKAAGASFTVVFVAEFGDITQLLMANMAARYDDPFAVGTGAVLALWVVGAIAVFGGKRLLRWIPLVWITRVAAAAMAAMCVASILSVVTR